MSKRFGNTLTARDLREEGIDAAAVRTLFYGTHYRQQLGFSDEALRSADEAVGRLGEFRARLVEVSGGEPYAQSDTPPEAQQMETEFRAALDDDLNAPRAVAAVFTFVRAANRELDRGGWRAETAAAALQRLDHIMEVLDVLPTTIDVDADFGEWVESQIQARNAARKARDWVEADRIRSQLVERGVELEDTSQGTRWKLRSG